MQVFITQYSPVTFYFLWGWYVFLSNPFSNTFRKLFSLNVSDQFFHNRHYKYINKEFSPIAKRSELLTEVNTGYTQKNGAVSILNT